MSAKNTTLYFMEPEGSEFTHWWWDADSGNVNINFEAAVLADYPDVNALETLLEIKGDSIIGKVLKDLRVQKAMEQVLKELGQNW